MTNMDQSFFLRELSELPIMAYRFSRLAAQNGELCELRCVSGLQKYALFILYKKGRHNMSELAEQLLITRQQLTKLVDALVEKGLAERGDDPGNRRHVMITLTESGRRCMEASVNNKLDALSKLLSALSDDDAKRFADAIKVIKEVLAKI